MVSLLLFFGTAAQADLIPPGETIQDAVFVDIPADGFSVVTELIPALVPEQIDVEGTSDSGGWSCFNYAFSISDVWVQIDIANATIVPQDGYLGLTIELQINVNEENDPFRLMTELFCADSTCDGYVLPFIATVNGKIYLNVTDIDGDGQNEVDAIVEIDPPSYDLTSDYITLDDCALGTIEEVLNFFGWSIYELVLDLATPALEDAVNDLVPELEETLEDAFADLNIQETFEVGEAEVNLNLYPTALTSQTEGLRLALTGNSSSSMVADCVAEFDPMGSKATNSAAPVVSDVPSGSMLGAIAADDFINQLLYNAWRGGILCQTIDEDTFALDTSILNLLSSDSFIELFPENETMVIETSPKVPLTLNMGTDADLAIDVTDLELKFYATVDYRKTNVLGVDLNTDVGVNLNFDNTTGALGLDLDLDPDRVDSTVRTNEFVPNSSQAIEDNFSGQLGIILGLIDIETLVGELNFVVPSYEGIGVNEMTVSSTGGNGEDLGIYAGVGTVPYAGCDEGSESSGCEGSSEGCATTKRGNGRLLITAFVCILVLRRRSNTGS